MLKRKTKRSPIELKLRGTYFWIRRSPEDLECTSGDLQGGHEAGGRAHPPGRALHPRGPLVAPLAYFFHLYIPIYPKTFGKQDRSGVLTPEASVAIENQSGPYSGTLPDGGSSSVAIFIIPVLSMTRRE